MSATKGRAYIDTIQGYLAPRIYQALGLGSALNINEIIESSTEIYPNPANNTLNIVSYAINIDDIRIINIEGKEIFNTTVNASQARVNTSDLATGLYIIEIKSENNTIKRKLIIE